MLIICSLQRSVKSCVAIVNKKKPTKEKRCKKFKHAPHFVTQRKIHLYAHVHIEMISINTCLLLGYADIYAGHGRDIQKVLRCF